MLRDTEFDNRISSILLFSEISRKKKASDRFLHVCMDETPIPQEILDEPNTL